MPDLVETIKKNEKSADLCRVVAFGEFSFDTDSRILWRGAETVQLAPKACELLGVLIENAPQVVSKVELMNRVWADAFVEEANLTHHISSLRKALGEDKNGRQFIETIPRKGYRFAAPIDEREDSKTEIVFTENITTRLIEETEKDEPSIKTEAAILPTETVAAPPKTLPTPRQNERDRRKIFIAAVVILITVAAGFGIYRLFNAPAAGFRAGKRTRLTSTGKSKFAAVSPDGKLVAHVQQTDEGNALWLRQIAAEGEMQIIAPANTDFRAVNFSPDGDTIYYITGRDSFHGTLYQTPALGGQAKKVADDIYLANLGVNGISFSPDGKQIAFIRLSPPPNETSFLIIADASGGNERILTEYKRPDLLFGTPAWSPGGEFIVCPFQNTEGMNALAISVKDASAKPLLPVVLNSVSQIVWLPDGRNLLMVAEDDTETVLYQIYQVAFADGAKRRVNQDFNNYESIGVTGDGRSVVAVRTEQTAHLWTMPRDDAGQLKQLTSGFEKYDGVNGLDWLADGRIFYESMPGGKQAIWQIDADGAGNRQTANTGGGYGAVSRDGRFFAYQKCAVKDGRLDQGLFLLGADEMRERRLTIGWDLWAEFAPDGKSINFIRWGEDAELATLRSIAIEGGEPTRLTKFLAITAAISPDGKQIAVARWAGAKTQIVILPAGGGEPIKTFDVNFAIQDRFGKRPVRWTADGRAVEFIRDVNGVSNLWRQPLDGSDATQITNFNTDLIFNFAFATDDARLVLSRGAVNSDMMLIENAAQ